MRAFLLNTLLLTLMPLGTVLAANPPEGAAPACLKVYKTDGGSIGTEYIYLIERAARDLAQNSRYSYEQIERSMYRAIAFERLIPENITSISIEVPQSDLFTFQFNVKTALQGSFNLEGQYETARVIEGDFIPPENLIQNFALRLWNNWLTHPSPYLIETQIYESLANDRIDPKDLAEIVVFAFLDSLQEEELRLKVRLTMANMLATMRTLSIRHHIPRHEERLATQARPIAQMVLRFRPELRQDTDIMTAGILTSLSFFSVRQEIELHNIKTIELKDENNESGHVTIGIQTSDQHFETTESIAVNYLGKTQ